MIKEGCVDTINECYGYNNTLHKTLDTINC